MLKKKSGLPEKEQDILHIQKKELQKRPVLMGRKKKADLISLFIILLVN